MATIKSDRRVKIKNRIRRRLTGTTERPRLSVFRSNTGIYAQIIDDTKGNTLVSASSKELGKVMNANITTSKEVGKKIAEKALQAGITKVAFDRNGYLYHGKIKALAEGAREGGLDF